MEDCNLGVSDWSPMLQMAYSVRVMPPEAGTGSPCNLTHMMFQEVRQSQPEDAEVWKRWAEGLGCLAHLYLPSI